MSTAGNVLCPRCKGALVATGQNHLRCPADGSTYELLFSRHGLPAPAARAPAQTMAPPPLATQVPPVAPPPSAQPPGVPAPQYQVPQPPGVPAVGRPLPPPPGAGAAPRPVMAYQAPGVPPYPGAVPVHPPLAAQAPAAAAMYGGPAVAVMAQPAPLADGSTCLQHPAVGAVCRCSKCATPTCNTCAFWLEDGLVLCPECAVSGQDVGELRGRRKLFVYWGLGLAIFATVVPVFLLLILFGTGVDPEKATMLAGGAVVIGFYPSLIGLGLSAGAIKWGGKNPALPWVGLIWNAVIVAPILLVMVVGMIMA